jgi:Domain of unknown function (DUF4266)
MKGIVVWMIVATSFAGCARVKAHQRGTLARPDMELGAASELAGGEQHARQYREGSIGGGNGKAGGCGCN